MRKIMKCALAAIVAVLLIVLYKVGSVYLADSADYTQADWLEYKLLTPAEIKNAPLFSDVIVLRYRAADGPAPQFNQIEYDGKAKVLEIQHYLISLGYREKGDPVKGKRWVREQDNKSASVAQTGNATTLTFAD